MRELKHSIEQHNLFKSALLVSREYQEDFDISDTLLEMENLINQCARYVGDVTDQQLAFERLREYFYQELAFSGDHNNFFDSKYNLLDQVLQRRTGIPVTLAIIFCQIGNAIGLKLQGVNFPGHFLIRFQLSDAKVQFIDPMNGKILSWQQLEQIYFSVLGEDAEVSLPMQALEPVDCQEAVMRLLHNLKASYINEQRYQKALQTIELVLQLCPDDPYERRDRGYLLHQLDCPQVAVADYQFFIDQCPSDPSIEMIRTQVDKLRARVETHH